MKIIADFAHHKVASNLLMLLMIVAGVFAINRINIQFFPSFELDRISVSVSWPGASAEDIEQGLTIPLEQNLKGIEYLKHMSSTSAQSISSIQLEFEQEADLLLALDKVKQKVAEFKNLPTDAEKPIVESIVRYESIAKIMIEGNLSIREFRQLTEQYEKELLHRGIDKVTISGLPEEEINISIPTAKLMQYQLGLEQLAQKIESNSADIPLGSIAGDEQEQEVRMLEQRRNALDFYSLPIINSANQLLTLADLASIEKREKTDQLSRQIHQKRIVELELKRTESGNALDAAEIMQRWLIDTRAKLPQGVQLTVYDESWKLIKERTLLLLKNGGGGLLLVVLILYLFLNAKVSFWVAVGIPVSFLMTLAILYLLGGTINMISLFGLIMALGIIVDDAIVVGEDALTHYQDGEAPLKAAEGGARRMFLPVLAASLTTIAAFLPLMMIGGIMGSILFDIPLIIICVIIASLIESFLILPGHLRYAFLHINKKQSEKRSFRERFDQKFIHFKEHRFRPFIAWALKNRMTTLAISFAMFVLALSLVISGRVGYSFFPSPESHIMMASVNFVSGTPKSHTQDYLRQIEQALYKTEQELGGNLIQHAISIHGSSFSGGRLGKRGDQFGAIYLQLIDPDKRSVRNEQLIQAWKKNIAPSPGLESLTIASRKAGPPGTDLELRLQFNDTHQLKHAANELSEALKTIKGVYAIENDMPYGREQLILELTPMGKSMGFETFTLAQQVQMSIDGRIVQIFQQDTQSIEVRLSVDEQENNTLSAIHDLYVRSPQGDFVPLDMVATWHSKQGFEVLRHSEGDLSISIRAEVDRAQNQTNLIIENLKQNVLPQLKQKYGIDYSFEGRSADERDTMSDMKQGVLLGMILIYIILAWIFASYGWPLLVMSIIPFGMVGAIVGHWLLGIDLTLLSMFGFFGLSGIVVNDSIILVSFYRYLVEKKSLLPKDAIEEASVKRLRAVLLTSLTTIAGLTPLLFETSLQAQFLIPMATSIAFGLLFSTFIVLIIVPVLLSSYISMQEKLNLWQQRSIFKRTTIDP